MHSLASLSLTIRVALLTSLVCIVAIALPLVALAGNGDPTGA